jgi:hypothetical protein
MSDFDLTGHVAIVTSITSLVSSACEASSESDAMQA